MSDFKAKVLKVPNSISAGLGSGAPPQTPLGELTAPPDLLAGLRGPTSRGGEGKGRGKGRGGGREPTIQG